MTEKLKGKNFPNLRFPGFEEEWEVKKLENIAKKITDGTHDTPKPIEKGIPFLTAIHIKDGFVDYNNCYYLDKEVHNKIFKRCNPEKNDLLIVNIGAGTATCALNIVDYEFSLKNVALVKPDTNIIDGRFLVQIQRKKSLKIFNQLTSGGAQPFLSLKEIGRLLISFPTIAEQHKISLFLSLLDDRITTQRKIIKNLETSMKGFREKIFTQKLRFKDDDGNRFSNWEYTKIKDLCEIKKGEQLNKDELTDDGSYPCLNGGINFSGYTEKYNSDENTITISEGGNSCGYINFLHSKFWLGGHCYKILLNENNSKLYFYHLLKFNEQKIMNLRVGSGLPNIQQKDLKSLELFVSTQIKEQTKIANFLSSIDEKIGTEKKILAQYEIQKKYLLANLFA